MCDAVADCTELEKQLQEQNEEILLVAQLVRSLIQDNATTAREQETYEEKNAVFMERYAVAKEQYEAISLEIEQRKTRVKEIELFISSLDKQPFVLDTWNERLWCDLLEQAKVERDGKIWFAFKNGIEIAVNP